MLEVGILSAYIISTHTLTWSVTFFTTLEDRNKTISTHTLTWSVTFEALLFFLTGAISTHTLTWSVTGQIYV